MGDQGSTQHSNQLEYYHAPMQWRPRTKYAPTCTNSPSIQQVNEEAEVVLQRIKAEMKAKKIDAGVDVKIKRMDVEIKRMDVDLLMETMKLKMIADGKITFDQYLTLNKINSVCEM
jgi:hypothetical protein